MMSAKLLWLSIQDNLRDAAVAQACIKTSVGQMQDEAMARYVAAIDQIFIDLSHLNDGTHLQSIARFLANQEAA
jgi:pyruvate-formate lyase-activating enzyme